MVAVIMVRKMVLLKMGNAVGGEKEGKEKQGRNRVGLGRRYVFSNSDAIYGSCKVGAISEGTNREYDE